MCRLNRYVIVTTSNGVKIVNIASSDNFDDILGAVKDSDSNSIILVIPKSNRVFKSKSRVENLKNNFDALKKKVSIISSSQEAVKNASSAGFNILRKIEKPSPKKDEDIISFYSKQSNRAFKKMPLIEDSKKFIFGLLGGAIVIFVFIVFASLDGTEIEIIPVKKDFSVNIPVAVSDKVTENDEVYGLMPGKWIELEKVFSKSFVSNAEKDVFVKAAGKITIYNNFSSSSQILVATTRFQTAEGFVFRIPKTIIVPGVVKTGNETKPGEIEVEAIADRAGEEYNIEPSDFRIPGFLGTPKYQSFYAKSFEKFSGGFIGRSNFVGKDDLQKAEEEIKEKALNEIKIELRSLDDFKILEEALKTEIEKTDDSNKVGDLVKEFKMGLKIKTKVMAFKEKNAADFIYQYVKNSQDLLVVGDSIKIDYRELKLDEEKRELSFNLVSSGQAIRNIDKNVIISEIAGKKKSEAEASINNLDGVESVHVSSPFWLRSVPKNINRIDIKITVK